MQASSYKTQAQEAISSEWFSQYMKVGLIKPKGFNINSSGYNPEGVEYEKPSTLSGLSRLSMYFVPPVLPSVNYI